MSDVVYMDIGEFRRFGYLQEVNRRFLHPLGLALQMVLDEESGEASLCGVIDAREDPEGMCYGELDVEDREKANRVSADWSRRAAARQAALGYVIQPIPPIVGVDGQEGDDLVHYPSLKDALVNFQYRTAEEVVSALAAMFPAHVIAEAAYRYEWRWPNELEPRLKEFAEMLATLKPELAEEDIDRWRDAQARAQDGPWFEVAERLPPRWRDDGPWSIHVLLQMGNAPTVMVARYDFEREVWAGREETVPAALRPWLWTYLPKLPGEMKGYAFRPEEGDG